MNRPVNYVLKALDEFMKDYNIRFGQKFYLYDWKTKKVDGYAVISPSYKISFNGEDWRDDRAFELLSGKYIAQSAEWGIKDRVSRVRGFELCSTAEDARLPERATEHSAGYDFFAKETVIIPPHSIVVAWTGVKAYMPEHEVLKIYNRSSNAKKKGIVLSNSVGIIDADYYNNPDNEGEIGFAFLNIREETVVLNKGEKLGQGIFETYNTADNDIHGGSRTGGFGSTGK